MRPEDTTLHSMLERAWELVEQTLAAERGSEGRTSDLDAEPLEGESVLPANDGQDSSLKLDDDGPDLSQKLDDFQLPPSESAKPKGRAKRRSELELLRDWSVNTVGVYQSVPESEKADGIQENLTSILLPLRGHNMGLEFCQVD